MILITKTWTNVVDSNVVYTFYFKMCAWMYFQMPSFLFKSNKVILIIWNFGFSLKQVMKSGMIAYLPKRK